MEFLKKNPLIKRFIVWYFLANSVIFCFIGASFLRSILLSDSLFFNFSTLTEYTSIAGKGLVLYFSLANYACFMMLLAAIPMSILLIISLLFPSNRLIGIASVLLASLSVVLLL